MHPFNIIFHLYYLQEHYKRRQITRIIPLSLVHFLSLQGARKNPARISCQHYSFYSRELLTSLFTGFVYFTHYGARRKHLPHAL